MANIVLGEAGSADVAATVATALGKIAFLQAYPANLLHDLAHRSSLLTRNRGELLARQADLSAGDLYILLEGVLLVRSGNRLISRLDRAGEIVGELAVLQSPPQTADIVVESAARVLAIRAETLALPAFDRLAASLYQILSYGLANWLRALTLQVHDRLDHLPGQGAVDAVSGLASRQRLADVIETLIAADNGLPFSMAMVDVATRDADAAPLDDASLTQLGARVLEYMRRGDIAARFDHQRIAMVLPNCDAANARNVIAALRAAIESSHFPEPVRRLSARFGLATRKPGESADDFLARTCAAADRATEGSAAPTKAS